MSPQGFFHCPSKGGSSHESVSRIEMLPPLKCSPTNINQPYHGRTVGSERPLNCPVCMDGISFQPVGRSSKHSCTVHEKSGSLQTEMKQIFKHQWMFGSFPSGILWLIWGDHSGLQDVVPGECIGVRPEGSILVFHGDDEVIVFSTMLQGSL